VGRPGLKPIKPRVGTCTLVAVVDLLGNKGRTKFKDTYAVWRCDCGERGRQSISVWRSGRHKRCLTCAKPDSKRGYNPGPALTAMERVERDAERVRRSPLPTGMRKREPVATFQP
jgi:hypothetical protein